MRSQLSAFFDLINGRSPFEIESYRQRGEAMARQGLVAATAFSSIEQALWDLAGQALDVPLHVLLGGKTRAALPVYANINRATNPRTPDGFAAAATRAVADGFRAIKAAPWDGFPPPGSPESEIARAIDTGVAAVAAMREAVGSRIAVMVDCHSFFDVEQAVRLAARLEPYDLTWYRGAGASRESRRHTRYQERIRQPWPVGRFSSASPGSRL